MAGIWQTDQADRFPTLQLHLSYSSSVSIHLYKLPFPWSADADHLFAQMQSAADWICSQCSIWLVHVNPTGRSAILRWIHCTGLLCKPGELAGVCTQTAQKATVGSSSVSVGYRWWVFFQQSTQWELPLSCLWESRMSCFPTHHI